MNDANFQAQPRTGEEEFVTCLECQRLLPQSEMVFLNKCWICAECKPVFLQRLKENIGPEGMIGILWRDGNKVVMRLGMQMPDRCFKCNQPGFGEKIKRQLQWYRPTYGVIFVAVAIIFGVLSAFIAAPLFPIGIFLFAVFTSNSFVKIVRFDVALCKKHKHRRFIAHIITVTFFVLGMLTLVCGIYFGMEWITFLVSFAFLIPALIYGAIATKALSLSKVTDNHVWLKGAGKEFLDSLPKWRGTN